MKCFDYKDFVSNVELFEKLCDLYFLDFFNLVGCFKFLFGKYDEFVFFRDELQMFGLKKEKDIKVDIFMF